AAPEEMSLDLGTEPTALAADGGEAQLREALGKASREVIEKIAWEVVPQLAETIVREIAERTMRERDGKG
ncbi:MAG: response regulator, partial [Myxococcaceae bacterium]